MASMGGHVTLSVRTMVLAAVAAVALLVSYAVGATGAAGAASAASALTPSAVGAGTAGAEGAEGGAMRTLRTISMAGSGTAVGVPDQVQFRLSVSTEADDVSSALASANQTMRRVLNELEGLGVERSDVETTGLSVHPDYDYTDSGTVLTGYAVKESVTVLVRRLALGSQAIATAVRAGGEAVRVRGVSLLIGDREALLEQARDAAVAEARAKAEQYAVAAGQDLGDVLTLREGSAPQRPVLRDQVYATPAAADAVLGKVPVRAGTEDLTVSVAIVWELS